MNRVKALLATIAVAMTPLSAAGGTPGGSIPEPETLALIGVGVVALIIAKTRKRR